MLIIVTDCMRLIGYTKMKLLFCDFLRLDGAGCIDLRQVGSYLVASLVLAQIIRY
jgi:hypothetical protein